MGIRGYIWVYMEIHGYTRVEMNEGVVSKLWCCVGGEVVYKNLVLSTELIM